MRRLLTALPAVLIAVVLLSGCGEDDEPPMDVVPSTTTPAPSTPAETSAPTTTAAPPSTSTSSAPSSDQGTVVPPQEERVTGIDASHHQGPIDWARVADHGISFAYLKASEGTGFVDPRFAEHRRQARREGIAVGGYHYFQLCSDGLEQARHVIGVLGPDDGGRQSLPPAVDLELAGSCSTPPPRDQLLAEVRAFLDALEEQYGVKPVVYLYPEFEDRFGFARELAGHPQWVRRLGRAEPRREWHIWQYDDRGTVPGISGGVDLNVMQPPVS